MLARITFGALMAVAANAMATQFPTEVIEYFDDTKIVMYVNASDVEATPDWSPAKGEPPLTIAKLIKDVEQWVANNPRYKNQTIKEIELKQFSFDGANHHWYYLVQLRGPSIDQKDTHYLGVLMNGKIIPALKEPDSYK